MSDGGDVVMRPVPAAKGCTVCDGCASFSPGSDNERVCGKPRCGHREAEHAPCVRKQYQFPLDQFNHRCGECGLYPSAHVEAEDAPCALTPEFFQSYQGRDPVLVNGRCSGCGLDVGRHLREEHLPAARRVRVEEGSLVSCIALTLDNSAGFMSLRSRIIKFAKGAYWQVGDERALSYGRSEETRLHLSVRFYFSNELEAACFVHRIDQGLPPSLLPSEPMTIEQVPRPANLILVQRSMLEGGLFKPTPRDECQQPLDGDGPASTSGRTVCGEDAECESISDPRLIQEGVKLEQCHIKPGYPAVPYNRFVCQRNLHAYFDGLPTMTTWRRRTVFLSMGPCGPRSVVGKEDRVFAQLRVHFLYPDLQLRHVFLHNSRLDDPSLAPSLSADRRVFTCWVGFKRGTDGNGVLDDDATAVARIRENVQCRLPPAEIDPTPPEAVMESLDSDVED